MTFCRTLRGFLFKNELLRNKCVRQNIGHSKNESEVKKEAISNDHPWVPVTTAQRVPWVVDGGVGLQIWRLAANILNKQSWTADQEWSSSLGVWREANNLTL